MKGLRKRLVNMFFWIRSNYFAPKEFLIKSIARMRFYRSKSKNMWTMTDQTMWGVTDKNISQDFLRANELSLGKTTMIIANMKVWIIQKWLATFDYHGFNFLNIHLEIIGLYIHCKIVQRIPSYTLHRDSPNVNNLPHKKYTVRETFWTISK